MALFNREYLKTEFEKLNSMLPEHVNLYMIGGGAMSFRGLKDATKDIDVVVRSGKDLNLIKTALENMQYITPAVRGPYKKMQASAILENMDGFRWDIFVDVVCGGLKLSDGMVSRSGELFQMDNVSVYMISLEDIFIFKSITQRERDLEDMNTVFLQGLDFEIIRDEIIEQNEHDHNFAWIAFFYDGIEELISKYYLIVPFLDEFKELAYDDMLSNMIIAHLKNGAADMDNLDIKFKGIELKAHLKILIRSGRIVQNSEGVFLLSQMMS